MRVPGTSVRPKPRRSLRNRSPLPLQAELLRLPSKCTPSRRLSRGRSRRRLVLSYVLIVVGTVLSSFVAGTYVWMYVQQRLLLDEWNSKTTSALSGLTKLSIPKIHLEDVVLEGTSRHSLLLGPAHLASSATPGDQGNAVLAGHRDTFFRHIHSLKYGDDIYILRGGKRFHYVVRARRIVDPHDLSVLRSTEDPELTLITCYPTHAIGPAPKRLVVVAKIAGGP
jgi:LPXTG-site transpeptidase (sortase) family protein